MTDEIAQALLTTLATIVPPDTQLAVSDDCAGCGHSIRVVDRGIGLCIICHMPGEWTAATRMAIQRQLIEAQEHRQHLARRGPTRAERVRAIRDLTKCGVWSVPGTYACGKCGASIKVNVGSNVVCAGCQLPSSWPASLRDRVQSWAIGTEVRA